LGIDGEVLGLGMNQIPISNIENTLKGV
jgi:hypothetical protein